MKANYHWILFGVVVIISSILLVQVNLNLREKERNQREISTINAQKDATRLVSNAITSFGSIIAGMQAFSVSGDSLPSAQELQSFLRIQLDGVDFKDPVVVSYIDTTHFFIYSFSQSEMNPDNLVGQRVNTFRDEQEIADLDYLMTHDDIRMFDPINLVEGWVGIPINFRVQRDDKTLGYIASLVMFKSIVRELYNSNLSDNYAFGFKINGVEFDREIVHDSTDVYNDDRDSEYHRYLALDNSISATSKILLFGKELEISTWPKTKPSIMSRDRILLLLLFTTFVIFSLIVTWQIHRQQKLLVVINHSNKMLKLNKAQIEEQNIQMLRLNATKDRFFSIIAHDLRSPLASIHGLMDSIMEEKIQNPAVREMFSDLRYSTASTLDLLDNLLRWAVNQTGDIPFKPFPINLYNIIVDTVHILNQSAKEKFIKMEYNIDEDIYCIGDKNMLTTVFRNLISNAIKYTPRAGKIDIDAHMEKNQIRISIKDNGRGIDHEQMQGLFDLSARVHADNKDDNSGAGLGLVLCKEFVEKHNGSIEVVSKEEVGSEFIVFLPNHERATGNDQ